MIKISQLSFKYPQSTGPVLQEINLEIKPATVTLIAGASGSGKSTLLRCINGLVPHFSGGTITGSIEVFGSDPIKEGPQVLASKVGFVFQEPEAQFTFDVVEDEIAFALENIGMPRVQMHQRINDIIEQMQLTDIRRKKVHEISGGEKQKVAIASALVSHPEVLILDEPTSQLDPDSAEDLLNYIVALSGDLGLTVLISEHRLERLLPHIENIAFIQPDHTLMFGKPREILCKMQQVPPIIEIAKRLEISPLPLTQQDFPKISITGNSDPNINRQAVIQPPTKPALSLNKVSTSLAGMKILKNISLDLNQGEILTLLGQNGAGKTTLLRTVLGLIPSEGSRVLREQDMEEMDLAQIIQHIAYLPQNPNDLLFAESVIDELLITLSNHGLQQEKSELTSFLSKFGLAEKQDRYPRDLSVGERQRTALAAVTVHKPQIILLDEPTRGMDYASKRKLAELLTGWRNQGRSILLVTHDVEFAARLADRVAIIETGELIFNGSPKTAFTKFPSFQTQTALLFPGTGWIIPEDVSIKKPHD